MRNLWLIIVALLMPFASSAETTFQNHLHQYTLKNGLHLIVLEQHRAPVETTQVWYRIGASNEPNGLTGISHALEHMMFEGTSHYKSGDFAKLITENGGLLNAATGYDKTYYYEEMAADKLPLTLKLEADRMHNLAITPASFKKEMQVVLEERRMRVEDNPQALTYERFMAAANISNPYHHMPIGWLNDIQHLTRENLQHWYEQWYAPNNAYVIVIGDVDAKHVYDLVKQDFGAIPQKTLPTVKPRPNQPALGKRLITVHGHTKLPMLVLGYSVPSVKTATVKWEPYALSLLVAILDSGDSARIARDLIRGSEIATQASANYNPYSLYSGQFIFSGIPSQGNTIADLNQAFMQQIKTLKTTFVSKTDLHRIITQVTSEKIYSQDSLMGQAQDIGEMAILKLPLDEQSHYLTMIKQITPAQLQAVAKKYLQENRLTKALLIPEKPGHKD